MRAVVHGSATTTEEIRRAIQDSQESVRTLASRYGINPKTVQKWRRRTQVQNAPLGPRTPAVTAVGPMEEEIIVVVRKYMQLPLDDCLYALQAAIPHLTRSSLHRCLQRHGISNLPQTREGNTTNPGLGTYPIGHFLITAAETETCEGRVYGFGAIDRTSKIVYAELKGNTDQLTVARFITALIEAVPYKIHTLLTNDDPQFTAPSVSWRSPVIERICADHDIKHQITKPDHPSADSQVERMSELLAEATVKQHNYQTHHERRMHLLAFLRAYNFGRRLKTLRGLTPHKYICKLWTEQPQQFRLNPLHSTLGLDMAQSGRDDDPST